MKVIRDPTKMQATANRLRGEGLLIGFVPTMGYLHEGHASLLRAARKRSDVVVLSIFVNPTQFGPHEDLAKYPRDIERDEEMARQEGVDYIFYPEAASMYPEGYQTYVNVEQLTRSHCGVSRPTHFRGVATVCTKLFNLVLPHRAYFGQKDYQQAAVIRRMVKDLNMNLEIAVMPTVREADGLAMSSRNVYLSPDERKDALCLHESLQMANDMFHSGESDAKKIVKAMRANIESKRSARIDYVSIVDTDTLEELDVIRDKAVVLLAVFMGKTRLIDNDILCRGTARRAR
ncbi:MAG: pantoate--beta-alanine ligase [Candidatus Abyssobacteria bacterium SURF_17]|uniref:Pantothenate synthetase n=1 Tax=Candidatus Abyssobacteria bacterium SURF_17 TaxID=2093361 RepID=A0A419F7J1_9BACT|nr:MAG: pantoate--beta-alanine ligase [Candidatus Abyssubacteria bacterium SURF_17]